MPEEIWVCLLSALSSKEEVGLPPRTSRGSPGEFDLLLHQVTATESLETALGLAPSDVPLSLAAERNALSEILTSMDTPALSSAENVSLAELSPANLPNTTPETTLPPEELEAVLKERDALAAILAQTPFVKGPFPEIPNAEERGESASVPMRFDGPSVGSSPEGGAVTPSPMVFAEPTVVPSPSSSSVAAETPENPLPRTTPSEVGKDYLPLPEGEERISTRRLLRSLQATVLGEESLRDESTPRPEAAEGGRASLLKRVPPTSLGVRDDFEVPRVSVVAEPLLRVSNPSTGTVSVKVPAEENNTLSARAVSPMKLPVRNGKSLLSTPLHRAQEVVLRRAARVAFVGESPLREGSDLSVNTPPGSQTVGRETGRILEQPLESLVRAERARPRVRPPEATESSRVEEWSSPEHTSRVVSQGATPPVTPSSPSATTTSVTTTPQVYTPLMEQIAQEARRNVRLGKREFRIQLRPAHLGSVELEVVWERDVVYVRITAASRESQKILEENIGELERALQKQGLGFEAGLPWKAPKWDLRRWAPPWRPGLTITRS